MQKMIRLLVVISAVAFIKTAVADTTYYDTLYFASLGTTMRVAVMVPSEYLVETGKEYPVLYTIPGSASNADNYNCWAFMNPMKERIAEKPMLVAMYAGYYLPEFFFKEFIPWVDSAYRTIPEQGARSVGGFSMGGLTSINYILDKPDMFSSALTMSYGADGNQIDRFRDSLDAGVVLPPVGNFCGTGDWLLGGALTLDDSLEAWGHPHILDTTAGAHEWPYWRDTSPRLVDYAWENFDLPGVDISRPAVSAAVSVPAGKVRYFDCTGRALSPARGQQGVMIGVDGRGNICKVLRIRD